MSSQLSNALKAMAQPKALHALTAINRGLEKESLRITAGGKLAQTPHPAALGSALTHGSITTDYSEALLEFITPVKQDITESLQDLEDVHTFVYQQLDAEMLWCTSMPCIVTGDDSIPVAQYGSSNVGRMKTVYRYGLGHRYGRLMQAISGIHYNWSMPDEFWQLAWEEAGKPGELQAYITERYLGLIRNFRRLSWLLVYLFGASPAVCSTFLRDRPDHGLKSFDDKNRSLYLPYATSLRMGDLGYNSDAQKDLDVCYNSLDNYIETLRSAIEKPHPNYASIPAGEDGNFQQLNNSLLQIENEFYSPIRPKRVARSGETALSALKRGGIEYIEVRCVDVSPFAPVGIDETQMHFLDTFLLYCLTLESPPCDANEQLELSNNLSAVVSRGREPELKLQRGGSDIALQAWGRELLEAMTPVSALFDQASAGDKYAKALEIQQRCVDDPNQTPSARILHEMQERDLPFFRLAMSYSEQWASQFRERPLSPEKREAFARETQRSLRAQTEIEAADAISFEQYLRAYFAQYKELRGPSG